MGKKEKKEQLTLNQERMCHKSQEGKKYYQKEKGPRVADKTGKTKMGATR